MKEVFKKLFALGRQGFYFWISDVKVDEFTQHNSDNLELFNENEYFFSAQLSIALMKSSSWKPSSDAIIFIFSSALRKFNIHQLNNSKVSMRENFIHFIFSNLIFLVLSFPFLTNAFLQILIYELLEHLPKGGSVWKDKQQRLLHEKKSHKTKLFFYSSLKNLKGGNAFLWVKRLWLYARCLQNPTQTLHNQRKKEKMIISRNKYKE